MAAPLNRREIPPAASPAIGGRAQQIADALAKQDGLHAHREFIDPENRDLVERIRRAVLGPPTSSKKEG